jgi:hypothetical protein
MVLGLHHKNVNLIQKLQASPHKKNKKLVSVTPLDLT